MKKYSKINSLKCPVEAGGCGQSVFRVTIDRSFNRVILDCPSCKRRISLPLLTRAISQAYTGKLDETGELVNP